jgi:hypothetical protein
VLQLLVSRATNPLSYRQSRSSLIGKRMQAQSKSVPIAKIGRIFTRLPGSEVR